MHFPRKGDFIDIHVHNGTPSKGIFILESLMAHEGKFPVDTPGVVYTYGIHPWFLNEGNYLQLITSVRNNIQYPEVIALGEAGFDRLRGPSLDLQRSVFEKQVNISEEIRKPLVIHCVRSWDEILSVHKRLKPEMLWLIHGFRGNVELATQLLSKGMYLSFWFDFALRPESQSLLRHVPKERIFLETDGAEVDIRTIYNKVAGDIGVSVEELKGIIRENFLEFFRIQNSSDSNLAGR
jgi:TatD DNase family protein